MIKFCDSTPSEIRNISELYTLAKSVKNILSNIDFDRLKEYHNKNKKFINTIFNNCETQVNTTEHVKFKISNEAVQVVMILVPGSYNPIQLYNLKFGEDRMESEYYKEKYHKPIHTELLKLHSFLESAEKQFIKEDHAKEFLIETELDKILLGE
jgi:hypothetical protein